MRSLSAAAVIALGLAGVGSAPAAAPLDAGVRQAIERFEPHRASYDLTLERARSGDVSSASGQLSFEWRDVCDGWSIRQLTRVQVGRSEGVGLDFGWRFDSWEAKDGTAYRFFIDRFSQGRKTETIAGRASLQAVGEGGTARFDQPFESEVALPAGTIFPTWHSFEMIALAEAEQRQIWRTVFDGSSEDDGLTGVSAVMLGEAATPAVPEVGAELLAGRPARRLYLAYYGMDAGESEPIHEQEVLIYSNGVADDFVFDYGDFALRAELVELEALPKPDC